MASHTKLRRTAVGAAAVTGMALVGAGLYPALASAGSPDLPSVSAEELLVLVAESEQQQLTGEVRVDAGPDMPGLDRVAEALGGPAGSLAALSSGNATLTVAVDGPDRQRLAVGDGDEELSVIHNGSDVWVYDEAERTVYALALPQEIQEELAQDFDASPRERLGMTPQEAVEDLLEAAEEHATVTVDGTARVADRDAYELLVETDEEVTGAHGADTARVAVDADTGVPLAVSMYRDDEQVIDVAFASISYEAPAGSTFDFTPPQGAEIVELDSLAPFLPDLAGLPS